MSKYRNRAVPFRSVVYNALAINTVIHSLPNGPSQDKNVQNQAQKNEANEHLEGKHILLSNGSTSPRTASACQNT